jgi:hypothetical protein
MSSVIYKREPDYVVYSINVLGSYYIGSTNDLKNRIRKHISVYKTTTRNRNIPLYKFIREAEEKHNFVFDKKAFDVEALIWGGNKDFARKIEKEVLLEYKTKSGTNKGFNMLNGRSPYQTEEEHKEAQKAYEQTEKYKEHRKAYRQREKYKEAQKVYRQTEEYKEYQKAYNQIEKRKEAQKAYRQTEEYKEYQKAYKQRKKLERLNNNTD